MTHSWTKADLAQIAARGLDPTRVDLQIDRFHRGFPQLMLDRPCVIGDGIVQLAPPRFAALEARFREARLEGRASKFVPASGAASRMFQSFSALLNRGVPIDDSLLEGAGRSDPDVQALREFLGGIERFAFHGMLAQTLAGSGGDLAALVRGGDRATLLRCLLGREACGFAELPKGLIPFHRYGEEVRTAFEEHMVEATSYVHAADGALRIHFTVPTTHRELIKSHLETCAARLRERFVIGLSEQDPSTDTLAVDENNVPLRDATGNLTFRPGGHGALLANLERTAGDLVFVRNIDNVAAEHPARPHHIPRERLAGFLLELEERVRDLLAKLAVDANPELVDETWRFLEGVLGRTLPANLRDALPSEQAAFLREQLDRPLRVCGMVRNQGEPGGGPFWVRHPDGTCSVQIVEGAQVDRRDAEQMRIFAASTHFNPVDLVCSLRDAEGRPYELERFADPDTGMIAEKSVDGVRVRALEWPGLWNGAMARWNTVFVELPIELFNPVKTVLDLLRPAHQPD